jgi:hypothetical protein
MAQATAKEWFYPASSWVHAFILTCDLKLAVWFKEGMKKVHGAVVGGSPEPFVCVYQGTTQAMYEVAVVSDPGKFVRQFLYKKLPYVKMAPPWAVGCGVQTTCCPVNTIPTTLNLTISNVSGCACLAGTYTLTYNSTNQDWEGPETTICGQAYTGFVLTCQGAGEFTLSSGSFGTVKMGNLVCSPFSCSVNGVTPGAAYCTGTVNLSVTT